MATKEEVKELADTILESRANVKKIPDLIKVIDNEPSLTKVVINSFVKVFTGLCKKGDFNIDITSEKNAAIKKYSTWLQDVFEEVLNKLGSLVDSKSSSKIVKELALTSFIKLLVISHNSTEETKSWSTLEQKRFKIIIDALLSIENDNQVIIERFQEYLEYPDAKFYTIQTLGRHSKKEKSLLFRQNLLKFLELLNYDENMEAAPGLILNEYEPIPDATSKNFNQLWTDFGKIQHKEVELYKRILILLTDKVMPLLKNPLQFTDFLLDSFKIGGSISLLSLNGVFILMTQHDLEYPDFYTKLYNLCTPELLHAKYRARFFYLANMFLASPLLPEYLVAAFVKRFSRLCLTAPANAILMVLPFIGNLLIRHKGLQTMIDCNEEHYDMDEPDPKKAKATESGLWEIKTLQNHVLPQVAQSAKFINKSLPQMEWNIEDYLEISPEDMFNSEVKKKVFVNVPLTFEKPIGCAFPKNDLVSVYFD